MVQNDAGFVSGPKDGLRGGTAFTARERRRRVRSWVWEGAQRAAQKWSGRKTLAFIVITCGTFWAAVAYLLL
jgi:hypothetical protein